MSARSIKRTGRCAFVSFRAPPSAACDLIPLHRRTVPLPQVGFLHGKTSHLCVCRRCAAQLREGVHRCPMCRQLIERIIDIYG